MFNSAFFASIGKLPTLLIFITVIVWLMGLFYSIWATLLFTGAAYIVSFPFSLVTFEIMSKKHRNANKGK
jgi:hypothetical protein